MRFPSPPKPPAWYWRLPIKWRQRYCRWFVWKWEAVQRFCTNILTRRTLFQRLPDAVCWTLYCLRADHKRGLPLAESLDYLGWYWSTCWRLWLHPISRGTF